MNDGGRAFPEFGIATGMSLLDWFAGQAQVSEDFHMSLAVAIAGPPPDGGEDPLGFAQWVATWQAKWRYMQAVAMIAERERRMEK